MATNARNKRLLTEEKYRALPDDVKKRAVKLQGGYYIVYPLELSRERFQLKESMKNQKESVQVTARDQAERSLGEELTINDFKKKNQELGNFVQNAGSVLDKDWRLFAKASPEMDWVKKSLNALNSILDENVKDYVNEQGIFDVKKYNDRINAAYDEFIEAAQNYVDSRDPGTPPGKRRKKQVSALLKRARDLKKDTKTLTDAIKEGAVEFDKMAPEQIEKLNTYNLVDQVKTREADPVTVEWQNQGNSTDVYRMNLLGSDGKTYYLKENLPFLNENIEAFLSRRFKQLEASERYSKSENEKDKAEERLYKITDKDYEFGKRFLKNLSGALDSVSEGNRAATEERFAKYFAHNFDDIFYRFKLNNLAAKFKPGEAGKTIEQQIEDARSKKDVLRVAALKYAQSILKADPNYKEGDAIENRLKEMTGAEWLQKELGLNPNTDKAFLDSLKGMSDTQIETMFRVTMGKEVELFGQMSAQKMQNATDSAAINNTATSRVAEHMGFDDVITKSRTALVKFKRRDGTEVNQLCTLMEEAPGKELIDLMKEAETTGKKIVYSSEAIRDLMRLQAIDTLTLQKDRHGRNFKCVTENDPTSGTIIIKSVKAYDNDMSFDAVSLADAFKKDGKEIDKLQFLPSMTTKVEKGSALYKHIVGSYFGVDVLSPEKKVETPVINIGHIKGYELRGDTLGFGPYFMWRTKNMPQSYRDINSFRWDGIQNVRFRDGVTDEAKAKMREEMEKMGIPFDGKDERESYRNYALEKAIRLSNTIKEIWDDPSYTGKSGWHGYLSQGMRKDLSMEERAKLSKAVEELSKLGKQFNFEDIKTQSVPVFDTLIKSISFIHGVAFGDTLDNRVLRQVNNYKDLEAITDKSGNLEIPTLLHYDKDAYNQLKKRAAEFENKDSVIYQKLKEIGMSDEKINALAVRNREMLTNLETAAKKAGAFYRLAGWTNPPRNEFFLEKKDYKEFGKLTDFAINPGNTYLAVDNENYLCGQSFKMRNGDHIETVPYAKLMNENEIKEAQNYNDHIRNDDKRWKYKAFEMDAKKFDVANTADVTANVTVAKDYIECCMADIIYEISNQPVNSKEELSAKIKDAIFLNGLANGLDKMENLEKPVKIEKAKDYMRPDSKFRTEFEKGFTHGAGVYYKAAFDAGVDSVMKENNFKQLDGAYLKKFNTICIDGMFGKVFENLKNPQMTENKVINLAIHAGKIASNTGVNPESALDHYILKHPGVVPENIVNAVKEGLSPAAPVNEGPQAGMQQGGPKPAGPEANQQGGPKQAGSEGNQPANVMGK